MSEIRAVGDFNLVTAEIITSAGLKINIKSHNNIIKPFWRIKRYSYVEIQDRNGILACY